MTPVGRRTMQAQDVMTTKVVAVAPDTPVTEIAKLLVERQISGVPVVSKERRLLGIVSEGDLIHGLGRKAPALMVARSARLPADAGQRVSQEPRAAGLRRDDP